MIRPDRVKGEVTFNFIRPPDRRVSIKSRLLEATDDTIVLATELSPSKGVHYLGESVMSVGFWAVWFLFKGRPFDVGRVYRPDGTWTGYYVDILEPVYWEGSDPNTLQPLTDLFLDIWIAPDRNYMILDEDEFEEAVRLGHITPPQTSHARNVLQELVEATERKDFPPTLVREFRLE